MLEQRYLNLIRRWLWLPVIAAIISSTGAYFFSKDQPSVYEANASLLVGPGIDAPNPDVSALKAGGQLMQTYAEISVTGPFLQSIVDELGLNMGKDDLRRMISIKTNQETQILNITVQDGDPQRAADIANAAANMLVRLSPSSPDSPTAQLTEQMYNQTTKLEQIIESTQATIIQLEGDLQSTTDVQKQGLIVLQTSDYIEKQRLIIEQLAQERTRLSDSLNALTILYDSLHTTTTNQVKIVEPAVPGPPITSRLKLTVMIAGLAGFVQALVIALVYEYFDDTVKTVDELVHATGVPVLAEIPRHGILKGRGISRLFITAQPLSGVTESYRILVAKLFRLRNKKIAPNLDDGVTFDEPVKDAKPNDTKFRSLLVGGIQNSEAHLEFAANLGVVIAKTNQRVILVDANLHRRTGEGLGLVELFGTGNQHDLIAMLRNSRLKKIDPIKWEPNLSILPSGILSNGMDASRIGGLSEDITGETPFGLLSSENMVNLIKKLESQADLVIISAAPLSSFADNLAMGSCVDGVLLLAINSETGRRVAGEVIESLESLDINVLGTVYDNGTSFLDKTRHFFLEIIDKLNLPTSSLKVAGGLRGSEQEETLFEEETPL